MEVNRNPTIHSSSDSSVSRHSNLTAVVSASSNSDVSQQLSTEGTPQIPVASISTPLKQLSKNSHSLFGRLNNVQQVLNIRNLPSSTLSKTATKTPNGDSALQVNKNKKATNHASNKPQKSTATTKKGSNSTGGLRSQNGKSGIQGKKNTTRANKAGPTTRSRKNNPPPDPSSSESSSNSDSTNSHQSDENPNEEVPQQEEEVPEDIPFNHPDPIEKLRWCLWNIPFIALLDHLVYEKLDLQTLYNSCVPSQNPLPSISKSRTSKYTAIDDAVGLTLTNLSDHFEIEVGTANTVIARRRHYRAAKQRFSEKFEAASTLILQVRKCLARMPSIFLYMPAVEVFFYLSENVWGPESPEALAMFNSMFNDLVTTDPFSNFQHTNIFARSIQFVSTTHPSTADNARFVLEHALRATADPGNDWGVRNDIGPPDQGDHAILNLIRRFITMSYDNYSNGMSVARGFAIEDDNRNFLWYTPLTYLLGCFAGRFHETYQDNWDTATMWLRLGAKITEADKSLWIANTTLEPNIEGQEKIRVFGYHRMDGNDYLVNPWDLVLEGDQFIADCTAMNRRMMMHNDDWDNLELRGQRIQEFFSLLKTAILVSDMDELFKPAFTEELGVDIGQSIFRSRMQEALTNTNNA